MACLICLRLHSPIVDDDEDNWSYYRIDLLPLLALLEVLVPIQRSFSGLLYGMHKFFSNFEHNLPTLWRTTSGVFVVKVKSPQLYHVGGVRHGQRLVGLPKQCQLRVENLMLDMHDSLSPQLPFQRLSLLFSAGWTRGRFFGGFSACVASWGLPEAITMSSRLICSLGRKEKMCN